MTQPLENNVAQEFDELMAADFDEGDVVAFIKRHLLSEEHRHLMFIRNVSIEDVLNGRVEGDQSIYDVLFLDWNAKLRGARSRRFGGGFPVVACPRCLQKNRLPIGGGLARCGKCKAIL